MQLMYDLEEIREYATESHQQIEALFSDDLQNIDLLVSIMDIGTEGNVYSTLELASIEAVYETENGINFENFDGFSMESMSDKIATSIDKTKKFVNKIVDAIKNFMKLMINIAINSDMLFEKYNKILYKLVGALKKKEFKDKQKSIEINTLTGIEVIVKASAVMLPEEVNDRLTKLKAHKEWSKFYDNLLIDIMRFSGLQKEFTVGGSPMDSEKFRSAVINKQVIEKYTRLSEVCDIKNTKDMSIEDARNHLLKVHASIQDYIKKDVKIQKSFREYLESVEDMADKLIKTDFEKNLRQGNKGALLQMQTVDLLGSFMSQVQSGRTKLFKHTTKCLNRLILNMRKLIND